MNHPTLLLWATLRTAFEMFTVDTKDTASEPPDRAFGQSITGNYKTLKEMQARNRSTEREGQALCVQVTEKDVKSVWPLVLAAAHVLLDKDSGREPSWVPSPIFCVQSPLIHIRLRFLETMFDVHNKTLEVTNFKQLFDISQWIRNMYIPRRDDDPASAKRPKLNPPANPNQKKWDRAELAAHFVDAVGDLSNQRNTMPPFTIALLLKIFAQVVGDINFKEKIESLDDIEQLLSYEAEPGKGPFYTENPEAVCMILFLLVRCLPTTVVLPRLHASLYARYVQFVVDGRSVFRVIQAAANPLDVELIENQETKDLWRYVTDELRTLDGVVSFPTVGELRNALVIWRLAVVCSLLFPSPVLQTSLDNLVRAINTTTIVLPTTTAEKQELVTIAGFLGHPSHATWVTIQQDAMAEFTAMWTNNGQFDLNTIPEEHVKNALVAIIDTTGTHTKEMRFNNGIMGLCSVVMKAAYEFNRNRELQEVMYTWDEAKDTLRNALLPSHVILLANIKTAENLGAVEVWLIQLALHMDSAAGENTYNRATQDWSQTLDGSITWPTYEAFIKGLTESGLSMLGYGQHTPF